MKKHVVKQGETLLSIAIRYGFADFKTIYNAPENAELKSKRPNPSILYPGDKILIPDKQLGNQSSATDQRHRFRRSLPKRLLRLRFLNCYGEPLSSENYTLILDGARVEGKKTDADGALEESIPFHIRTADIEIAGLSYSLALSHLDPVTAVTGIQARLNNLGFFCGSVDGVFGPKTRSALAQFQRSESNLTVQKYGQPENPTLRRLAERHDGIDTSGKDDLKGRMVSDRASASAASSVNPDQSMDSDEQQRDCAESGEDFEDFDDHPPHDDTVV